MATNEITYPQYRKYSNNKSFFKVISPEEFEEIQEMNGEFTKFHFTAKVLPERNYISDLTFEYEEYWQKIEEEEYKRMEGLLKV